MKESPELKADLEALFKKHGGSLETLGHPTTTLEELFLKIVEESKARPGRRYLPTEAGPVPLPPAPLASLSPAAPAPALPAAAQANANVQQSQQQHPHGSKKNKKKR